MELLTADDPSAIGDYRLLRRLGAGGMGRVYLGRTAGGRTVAVKVVRPELADDPEFRARFRQEVSAARRVGGRWTAPVLDADTEGPRPWVATGYVAGPALGEAVRTAGPLPVRSVHALGARLAEALEQVHALGLVHRDVKPSNVLLTLDGPRLIDFGVARALDAASTYTHSGYVVGSPGFMSPEQAAGSPTGPAGDVFSLGALLAYAATGTAPFGEGVSAPVLLYRVLHEEPELGGLDGELLDTVTACLAKDPAHRPTPAALRARLAPGAANGPEGWLPGPLAAAVGRAAVELLDLEGDSGPAGTAPVDRQPTVLDGGPRRAPRPEPVPGPGRRRRTLWAVLAAVAVLAAGYGGLAAGGHLPWNRAAPGSSPSPGQDAVTGTPSPGAAASGSRTPRPSGAASPGGSASASSSASAGTSAGASGSGKALPDAFLGTFRGDITTKIVPLASTFTVTFTAGRVGEEVGRTSNASQLSSTVCRGVLTLLSVTDAEVLLQERPDGNDSACTGVPEKQRYTLLGTGGLHLAVSGAPLGSDPEGDLAKQ
ncbi:serine/threonine-protein kinase [Kitasatospora cineracea]|uniref:Serine/threonine protein kinase n=1 Tax=Kitasatospora cineracea TaxID=88074 RepID=A0A8G1UJ38_9ACTN|nr:serine/threonine-protein kinase [Kitasatospora cineracea]ROR42632.1 serine/threonine protein kinase [Kitasatospora cineracea]